MPNTDTERWPVGEAWDGTGLDATDFERVATLIREFSTIDESTGLVRLLGECAELVGAEHCLALRVSCFDGLPQKKHVVNHSYPKEWLDLYETRKFGSLDPILRSHLDNGGLQWWREVYRNRPTCPEFQGLAEEFGLVDGITNGLTDTTGGTKSLVSYASRDTFRTRERLLSEVLIAPIHFAVTRVVPCIVDLAVLTPRELEILRWAAVGKTSWEISRLYAISERTVKFHLGNIFRKLGVLNRAQAIGAALRLGISLNL